MIELIVLLVLVFTVPAICVGLVLVFVWVLKQAVQAQKYRKIMAQLELSKRETPPQRHDGD